jgi:hypothetical protein
MFNSMAGDIWREWRQLLAHAGLTQLRPYSTSVNFFVIAAFGIGIPWRRGLDFFDPLLILLYSFIALLFAAPAITDLLGSDWSSSKTILARIFASALFGWSAFCLILFLGIATVNYQYGGGRFLLPPSNLLGAALALSLTACLSVSALGALFTVVLNPAAAKLILRGGFVVMLAAFVFGGRFVPGPWRMTLAENMTSRRIVHSAWVASVVFAIFAAGPVLALRFARKRPEDIL